MMKLKLRGSMAAIGSQAALGLMLTACSSETPSEPAVSGVNAPIMTTPNQLVPEDATEFLAIANVDADGNVTSRQVILGGGTVVQGFDRSALPPKASDPPAPRSKINPILSARLRPSSPAATTEVVVSIAHDAPFTALTKLRRDQPRTSPENAARLSDRIVQIAAVDRRRKPFRDAVVARARARGAVLKEEFTMGNGVLLTIPDSAVADLAADPNVLDISPRFDGTTPPATISDGTSLATGMNSDYWRPWMAGNLSFFYAVALDTGARSTHTLFTSGDGGTFGLHGDCSNGNASCSNFPFNPAYNDQDNIWNHGTGAASIIRGGNSSVMGFGLPLRGVSKVELDYYNVYTSVTLDAAAVVRGFTRAANTGDDLVIAEIQSGQSDSGMISLAADDAFDQGLMVIAACGNSGTGGVTSPAAPGNAHKALSIGDYDAVSGTTTFQVPGIVDGRIKPDFQAPTTVDAAGNGSDTAKRLGFNGTSGATAFAGGAAAIMYHWYNHAFGLSNKPGNVYTALLAQGNGPTLGSSTNGTGQLKMESGSQWGTGSFTLGTSAVDVTFSVPASRKNLKVVLWWPEKQSDSHDDIDLQVFDQAGVSIGTSTWAGNVWEVVKKSGNLTAGTYKMRFIPFSMPRTSQVIYYSFIMSYQ